MGRGHNRDMKLTRLIFSCSACLTIALAFPQQRVASLTGNIQKLPTFHSKILGNDRNIAVYLPPGYESGNRHYPVLYMNDGQNVFDGMTSYLPNKEWRADESAQALIESRLIEPIIIVAIDNGGMERANEYLPTEAKFGSNKSGGKADLYARVLIEEVMPLINEHYRTKKGPENTGLCGSSFGGIVTMHIGLKHPDVFGKLAVVSPSVWWDSRVILKEVSAITQKPKQRIWVDIGSREAGTNEKSNNQTTKDTEDLVHLLGEKGWKLGKNLAYFVDKGAAHNEDAWAHRMPLILTFLFGTR